MSLFLLCLVDFDTIVSRPFLPWVLDSCSTHLFECLHVRSLHQFWISLRLKIVLPIEEAVVMYSNNLRSDNMGNCLVSIWYQK